MNPDNFLAAFEEFLGRNGWPATTSPWHIVEQWKTLVDQAAAGTYQGGFDEYSNELTIRDLLAKALEDPLLKRYAAMATVRDRVREADSRLKKAFLSEVEIGGALEDSWWRRGVLAKAGSAYVEDMARIFGISIPE
jgi:hypothetical protein